MTPEERSARSQGWHDARASVAKAIEEVTGRRVPDGGQYVNDIKLVLESWGRECHEAGKNGQPKPTGRTR